MGRFSPARLEVGEFAGIEDCEGNRKSRRRVRQSVSRYTCAFPCSFGQMLSRADAGYKPALPEGVVCADGHTICGEKHRTANETAKEIGHADAGYKPALPENVVCADGHRFCGEKHRGANDFAWKFDHADAGCKLALPEGVDGCGRAHNLWRKVLDCTRSMARCLGLQMNLRRNMTNTEQSA